MPKAPRDYGPTILAEIRDIGKEIRDLRVEGRAERRRSDAHLDALFRRSDENLERLLARADQNMGRMLSIFVDEQRSVTAVLLTHQGLLEELIAGQKAQTGLLQGLHGRFDELIRVIRSQGNGRGGRNGNGRRR